MKAKIICMASAKGGSGKTILTATFGQFLSTLGKKVLLIDTDASTNGLTLLYLKEVLTNGEILTSNKKKSVGVYQQGSNFSITCPETILLPNNVSLIPATYAFQNTEIVDLSNYKTSLTLIKKNYESGYDYIFLDAQAGSDLYAKIAMSRDISDEVIIVSEYDPLSAAGIERLKGLFREDLTYDRTWILLNKMLPEFVKSFSDFMEVARYLSPIPWNAAVVKSYARRRLALDMENANDFTVAVMQVLKSLLGDEIDEPLSDWAKKTETSLLQPLKERYKNIEIELQGIELIEKEATKKKNRKLLLNTYFKAAPLLFIALIPALALYDNQIAYYLKHVTGEANIFGIISIAITSLSLVLLLNDFQTKLYNSRNPPEDTVSDRRKKFLMKQLQNLETLNTANLGELIKESAKLNINNLGDRLTFSDKDKS